MLHSNMIVDIEDNTFQDLSSLQVKSFLSGLWTDHSPPQDCTVEIESLFVLFFDPINYGTKKTTTNMM